ncbi:MAG: energy transducer TonB [Flavobacteriales bacterium]|jgi:TonB family protein|nr:energy transducer TonB [Flavobacteriales bacterium]
MRDELHLMELVDRYLDGSMNAADRAAFEERASKSAELRELIDDQRALREGVARVPVRAAAAKAYRAYRFGKPGPWIGGSVIVAVIGITAAVLMLKREAPTYDERGDAPRATIEEGITATEDALRPLLINVDTQRDTTVLSPGGIVLDIPRGCFIDSLGRTIASPVQVTLKEALTAIDIVKAGLSTMSGDTLLETGGMFHIDARQNGRVVRIDPSKAITAMVPAQRNQEGMMLYRGEELPDGRIDWRDPQPLKKSLVPVDITTLNFYPPGYVQKLAELGQAVTTKAFKDSLYYSFCYTSSPAPVQDRGIAERTEIWPVVAGTGNSGPVEAFVSSDTTTKNLDKLMETTYQGTGIDPAKVMTIWQPRFNGSNLATREFEERMRAIHGTCDNAVLDLYVNNLDQDLSELDSRAVRMGHAAFSAFTRRNDGRVDLPKHAAERLRTFYEKISSSEADAIRKTQEKFWNEQWKQDVKSDAKRADHAMAESVREGALFQKELAANLDTVYKQLGYKQVPFPRAAWVVPVSNSGWWNVDKAVLQATVSRSSMSYTDDQTGKTAALSYTPLIVEVADRASFDELVVYLIPDQLNSYQRMNEQGGGFEERLNTLFTYDLLCLGMKGSQQFAFAAKASGQSRITASLAPTDDNGLRAMLRTKGNVEENLLDESRYLIWSAGDRARQKRNTDRVRLRQELMPVVFPCTGATGVPAEDSARVTAINEQRIETAARFPGGEEAMWAWLRERMKVPADPGGDGRVVLVFTVEADGSTTNHAVQRSGGAACDREALRVVRMMPKWEPSRAGGRPVACRMQLPVSFSLR